MKKQYLKEKTYISIFLEFFLAIFLRTQIYFSVIATIFSQSFHSYKLLILQLLPRVYSRH